MSDDGENTIAILFARNPFDYTKTTTDDIVEHYRTKRAEFKQAPKAVPNKPDVNLTELGLL